MKAYVYYLEWPTGKKYIGIRKSETIDLWIKYFTSSKVVKKYRETNGEPHIIEIIEKFDDFNDAAKLEQKLLTENNAAVDETWLNRTNGNLKFLCKGHSPETRQKIGKVHLGKKRPESTILKMKEARKKQVITEESKKKMSESAKRRANSEEGKKHLKNISPLGTKSHKEKGYKPISEQMRAVISNKVKEAWVRGDFENRKTR